MGWLVWAADHNGPLPSAAREKARLLSSYNNNSNNPRRGTDLLHGAWWASARGGRTRATAYPM